MGKWLNYSVFISSTFEGFQSERDYLASVIFPRLRSKLTKSRINLIEIDLRWGITETAAANNRFIESCLDEIENSIPLFILLCGSDYGTILEEFDDLTIKKRPWLKQMHGRSATEIELEFALKAKSNPLICIRTKSYKSCIDGCSEILPAAIHDSIDLRNAQMIERNISSIDKIVSYTQTNTQSFRKGYIGEDWAVLDEGIEDYIFDFLKRQNSLKLQTVYNEENFSLAQNEVHLRFAEEKMLNYAERFDIQKKLENAIFDDDFATSSVVHAGPGYGKTSLLSWIAVRIIEKKYNCILFFSGATSISFSENNLIDYLTRSLVAMSQKPMSANNSGSRLEQFRQTISLVEFSKPLIVVIDGLDEIRDISADTLSALESEFRKKRIRLVVSCRQNHDLNVTFFSKSFHKIFQLKALKNDEHDLIVSQRLRAVGKNLSKAHLKQLGSLDGACNPMFLNILLTELIYSSRHTELSERIEEFRTFTGNIFEKVIERLLNNYTNNSVASLLRLFSICPNGIRERDVECCELTSCNTIEIFQIVRSIRPYVSIANGRVKLAHIEYSNTIIQHLSDTKECHEELHEEFSIYLRNEGYAYFGTIDELPFHYAQSKNWKSYEKLLTDIYFLEAKIEDGQIDELLNDYAMKEFDKNRKLCGTGQTKHYRKYQAELSNQARLGEKAIRKRLHANDNAGQVDRPIQMGLKTSVTSPKAKLDNRVGENVSLFHEWRTFMQQHRLKIMQYPQGFADYVRNFSSSESIASSAEKLLESRENTPEIRLLTKSVKPSSIALVRSYSGHQSSITSLDVSVDGRKFISGSRDGTARIWNSETGECQFLLDAHTGWVTCVSISENGEMAASGGTDGLVIIWNAENGERITSFIAHHSTVFSVNLITNGKLVVTNGQDHSVRLWDTTTGKMVKEITPKPRKYSDDPTKRSWDISDDNINTVSTSFDGLVCLFARFNEYPGIWSLATGNKLQVLKSGFSKHVKSLIVSRDGQLAAAAMLDASEILIYENQTASLISIVKLSNKPNCFQFTDDKRFLILILKEASGHNIIVYDLKNLQIINKISLDGYDTNPPVDKIALSCDGSKCITSGYGSIIYEWNLNCHSNQESIANRDLTRCQLLVTETLGEVAVSARSGEYYVDKLDGLISKDIKTIGQREFDIELFFIKPLNQHEILAACGSKVVFLCASETKNVTINSNASVIAVSFAGNYILLHQGGCDLTLWERETQREKRLKLHFWGGHFTALAISSDGKFGAACLNNDVVHVFDTQTGVNLHVLVGHRKRICHLVFSKCGMFVISGADDGEIRFWNVRTAKCISVHSRLKFIIRSFFLSNSGNYLVCSDGVGAIIIDAFTTKLDKEIDSFEGGINLISMTSDECHLVIVTLDNFFCLLNLETLKEVARFQDTNIATAISNITPKGNFCYATYEGALGVCQINGVTNGLPFAEASLPDLCEFSPLDLLLKIAARCPACWSVEYISRTVGTNLERECSNCQELYQIHQRSLGFWGIEDVKKTVDNRSFDSDLLNFALSSHNLAGSFGSNDGLLNLHRKFGPDI